MEIEAIVEGLVYVGLFVLWCSNEADKKSTMTSILMTLNDIQDLIVQTEIQIRNSKEK